jgi:ABC-type branched-subunit amino acid transport system substrate-binding protein
MAKLRVTIIDEVRDRRLKVDLPDDAVMEKLLPALAKKMGLPPADYRLTHEATGRALGGEQTLASFGVGEGDALRLAVTKKTLPVWGWMAIGGMVLLIAMVGAFLAGRGAKPVPTPTVVAEVTTSAATSAAMLQPTDTPVPTATPQPTPADPWGQVIVPPGDTVNLAFVGALSGEMALLGEVQKKAFLMAIEDVATIKGFSINASVIADGGCFDRDIGRKAADAIVSNPSIVGVVGHSCSASCDEGAAVYEKARLAVISPSCTWAALTEHGFQVFNRVAIPYDQGEDDPNRHVVNTSAYHEFANRYQSHYDWYIPEGVWGGEWYAAYAYDATAVLIQAIEQVAVVDGAGNLVIGRQALANAVRATSGYQGVTGIIGFDSEGDRLP